MPANRIKTKDDERDWALAKRAAADAGRGDDWRYVNGVFQRLKERRETRQHQEELMDKVAAARSRPPARRPVIRKTHSAHEFAVVDE